MKLKKPSIFMMVLVVVAFIAVLFVEEADAQFTEVKFRGTATTDEEWGDLTCYGSYWCYVTVDEILYDPNGTLATGQNLSICYSVALSLIAGDVVECYGYYCTGPCPLQLIGHVVCIEDPYYVHIFPSTGHIPSISISPQQPSEDDKVNVSVTFHFYSQPPYVESFGPLIRSDNTFFVDVVIFLPAPTDIVMWIVHDNTQTYNLGELPEGAYEFQVYVNYTHWMEGTYYLAETASFNVGPPLPFLSISPSETNVFVGQELSINITIHDVSVSSEMVGWSFMFYAFDFDELFTILSVTEGPFMKQSPTLPYICSDCTYFVFYDSRWDQPHISPFYQIGCMLLPDSSTEEYPYFPEGSGVLVTLNLRAIAAGNYTFRLLDSQLWNPAEELIHHNTIDGHIRVVEPIFGDVNFDNRVDMEDIALGALSFGSYQESPRWNPQVDVDKNGRVDLKDIALIARSFGQPHP